MKLLKVISNVSIITLGVALAGTFGLALSYYQNVNLEDLNKELAQSSQVFDKNGVLLDEIHGEEHRRVIDITEEHTNIKEAVIAIEDKSFYKHNGVSFRGVLRAARTNYEAGANVEGASTITMQLVKNLDGSVDDRTWSNKIREAFMALKLERSLTKSEILELYLNTIYWGNNTYGVETASETYFGKSASELSIPEASMMAALIQNPSRFNPYAGDDNYSALKVRQLDVLQALAESKSGCVANKSIKERELRKAQLKTCREEWTTSMHSAPLLVSGRTTWQKSNTPFVSEAAINEFMALNNLDIEDIEVGGFRIYTTVDKKDQDKAVQAVAEHSAYKGEAQIALVSIDVDTNKIVATVGSKDFDTSPLNRSLESYRQPGSSVKPFVYYTAFAYGIDTEYILADEAYCPVKATRWNKAYCPKNYGGSFAGPDTLRNHLVKSRNIPAVKLGQIVGIENVIKNMKRLGFTTKLENIPSFPLGSNDLKPVEMANAYAAFANGGYTNDYTILERVEDVNGEVYIDNSVRTQRRVLNNDGVYKIDSVLRDVVTRGTGYNANVADSRGKTGTTDQNADVWFVGYTDDISTAVWIGNDDYHKKLYGLSSGGSAAPIYRAFVEKYYN